MYLPFWSSQFFEWGPHFILYWIHKLCNSAHRRRHCQSIVGQQKQGKNLWFWAPAWQTYLPCGLLGSLWGQPSRCCLLFLIWYMSVAASLWFHLPEVTSGSGKATTASDPACHCSILSLPWEDFSLPIPALLWPRFINSGLTSMVLIGSPHPLSSRNLGHLSSWVEGC